MAGGSHRAPGAGGADRALLLDPFHADAPLDMAHLFKNARSALQDFFLGRRQTAPGDAYVPDSAPAATRSPLADDVLIALDTRNNARLLELLRPQPGLAAALRDLQRIDRL